MFYDKKIKYLDYCENGERISGGGFVKTEVKERNFKLYLSVRGLRLGGTVAAKVVLCGKEEESILGQMTLENGQGEFRHECQIGGEGLQLSYEEITGIRVLLGENHELKCGWKKETVAEGERRAESEQKATKGKKERSEKPKEEKPNEETAEKLKQEKSEKPKAEKPNAERTLSAENESEVQRVSVAEERLEEQLIATESRRKMEQPPAVESRREMEPSSVVESRREMEQSSAVESRREAEHPSAVKNSHEVEQSSAAKSRREVEVISAVKSRKDVEQSSAGEKQTSRVIPLLEDKWNQICAIYPHVKPFEDQREYLSIGPADFVMFTAASYRAANNSFLLHGYYNYKHLILTRVEQRGEILYYLGVPGNYYAREKQVAVIFGFESFECAEEPAQDGDFGYYLMKVQL